MPTSSHLCFLTVLVYFIWQNAEAAKGADNIKGARKAPLHISFIIQAGERPETHRSYKSKRVYERIVIALPPNGRTYPLSFGHLPVLQGVTRSAARTAKGGPCKLIS